jgi:hypothetical protein
MSFFIDQPRSVILSVNIAMLYEMVTQILLVSGRHREICLSIAEKERKGNP